MLPETLNLLVELASNMPDSEPIFRADRFRGGIHEPLGEDGMRDLIYRLYNRAGIAGHIAYDLRDSFSQIAFDSGCDYNTVEALLRHEQGGEGKKYFKYSKLKLINALEKYSPLRVIKHREFDPPPSPPETRPGFRADI